MGAQYLQTWLAPLLPMLARPDVTDIFINRPGEVWIETLGGALECCAMPELDEAKLWLIARQIASHGHQGISREHPLLAATLPAQGFFGGARVQIVAPPATRGPMALAFRKHLNPDMDLGDYLATGSFANTQFGLGPSPRARPDQPAADDPQALATFLAQMVRQRRNILISGGTSSGKTTFLNALIREIPCEERLITIEDTAEISLSHANHVGLIAARGELGEARVSVEDLLQASLRMRPDRILLGELRGAEAYTFLRAVNTGHPGSMTTIHADSPEGAIEQLALVILQSGAGLRREDIVHYVGQVVDVIVQLERRGGQRQVARIMMVRGGEQ